MEGMTLEKLQVIIEAQTSQYMDAMKKVQNQTNSTVSKVNNSLSGAKKVLGVVGKAVGGVFAAISVASFGKACIQIGSDLAEVQNVVDVTFGACNKRIEDFSKTAAEQFGLSELAAKQYTSTMGAMLKSMGFTGEACEDMSMELAGLAGDMASFYNLDADTAFAKIRSGISGETEPLKQLGINLSVANLEAYALSQGITKSYKSMTQQEQALLRYNYLLNVTADAQGDFARTSDSWANQTRILQLRMESIKATIGQGLINVLTPVIKMINLLVAKLQVAADAFKRFTEIITGKKSQSADMSVGNMSASLGAATDNAEDLTSATNAAGKAAKKAEEAFHGLGKFDEVNSLSKASDDTDADTGGGGGTGGAEDFADAISDTAEATEATLNPAIQLLIDKLKELRDLFTSGFKAGFGDTSFEPIEKAIGNIQENLIGIWMDPEVVGAASGCLDKWTYALGQVTGAVASVGTTIATNIVGGADKYLEQNSPRIKDHIVSMFDITGSIGEITGNFAQAGANIFSVFGGETGQQVTANITGIFADASMGVEELTGKLSRDTLDMLTRPIIDNQEEIKTALEGTLETVEKVSGDVKGIIDEVVDKANKVYDEHFKPLHDSIAEGLSDTAGKLLVFWNTKAKPVVDKMTEKLSTLLNEHVKPFLTSAVELLGTIADAIKVFWQNVLKPTIDWIIANVLPVLLPILTSIWNTITAVFGKIFDILKGVIRVIKGTINFIVGVFTGDWEKAWGGIKDIFCGTFDIILGFLGTIWESIKGIFSTHLETIKAIWSVTWNAVKTIVVNIFNQIKTVISTIFEAIKANIEFGLAVIKLIWTTVWNAVKTTVITIFNNIKTFISNTIEAVKSVISTTLDTIKNIWTNSWNAYKTTVTTIFNAIKNFISTTIEAVKTGISTTLDTIKEIWSTAWNTVKSTVTTIFNNIKSTISEKIEAVKTGIDTTLEGIKTIWSNAWESAKSTVTTIFSKIKETIDGKISDIKTGISTTLDTIKETWSNTFTNIKETVSTIFTNLWNSIKGTINSIIGGVESMANSVVGGINTVIGALNNLSFTVPDWVPELGGKTFGFNIPTLSTVSLPKLATGGIVDGATPLIAGEAGKEAILPLEKNTGWMDTMAAKVAEILSVNIMGALENTDNSNDYQVTTTVNLDGKTIATQIDKYKKRTGYNMRPIAT